MRLGDDELIVEPDHMPSEGSKRTGPLLIALEPILVNGAVELDNHSDVKAREIGDVAINGNLTAKLETGQLASAQEPPELAFGESLEAAQFAGAVDAIHGGVL